MTGYFGQTVEVNTPGNGDKCPVDCRVARKQKAGGFCLNAEKQPSPLQASDNQRKITTQCVRKHFIHPQVQVPFSINWPL